MGRTPKDLRDTVDRVDSDTEPVVILDDGKPVGETYNEAHTRRETAAADREEFNRDIAKIERDTLRGKLVTAKEATAAAAAVRDAFIAIGKQLWPRVDLALGDMPASEKQRIAQAMRASWEQLLGEMSG